MISQPIIECLKVPQLTFIVQMFISTIEITEV